MKNLTFYKQNSSAVFNMRYSYMRGFYELSRTIAFFSLTIYFPDILCQASVTGVTRSIIVIHSQEVDDYRDRRLPILRTNLASVQFEV